ncbi:MAG: glucose-1-phosphate cytidylyltransferase [Phycisphaerales bacterium]|nr:MAG: glucose-1-phosphate cytidylyltransferase [Phycisphaerales bacterium]
MSEKDHIEFGPCKVAVLAGGFGTRLAERTDEMPKPMVEVAGRPILWHILKIYSHHGFRDFVIACGYKGDQIKRFFLEYRHRTCDLVIDFASDRVERLQNSIEPWRVALIDTGSDTMTGGRIRRLARHLGDSTFMLTYGDGVADLDIRTLLDFHRSHGKLATFTAVHPPEQFGRAKLDGSRVVSFAEKPQAPTQWINGGFFVLEPGVHDFIDGDETSFELETMPRLVKEQQLMAYPHEGFWHPMDTLRDVRNLNAMWNENAAPWKLWS